MLESVHVGKQSIGDYEATAGREVVDRLRALAEPLKGARVLHLNATPYGGVAEIFSRRSLCCGIWGSMPTVRRRVLWDSSKGGTLTVDGLLYLNRTSWAHVLAEAARVLDLPREKVLRPEEAAPLDGKAPAEGTIF